jgi:hypothetical protein
MAISTSLSNKYYICFPHEESPILWDITQHIRPDCAYWGKVFEAVEQTLETNGLTFYLTWNTQSLPSYGDEVVAVVLGDERCCIPAYFNNVRAIFKCYGFSPILGCNLFLNPSFLNLITLVHFTRNWLSNLLGLLRYKFYRFKSWCSGNAKTVPLYEIPLGYYNQLDLPIQALEKRSQDVFFAGSMMHGASLASMLDTPKSLSRKQMVHYLQMFKDNHPKVKVDLDITPAFLSISLINKSNAVSYSKRMMNTKICLVPRGGSFETFRFFEGLRYGCIVVTETLPPYWFYQGSPTVQVRDWSKLSETLETLLNDEQLLRAKHQDSLSWWQTQCSEGAVGAFIAKQLNAL